MKQESEVRILDAQELEHVCGGGIVDTAKAVWDWIWTPSEAAYHPVEQCPQCFTGGGGARG